MPEIEETGWQRMHAPREGRETFVVSPFTRLARTHALAVAGDTLIALALAGSLFFNIPADDARWQTARYLALTMAPFSVVAPLIGPWLDRVRGGRRWVVVGANAGRAAICVLMINHLDSLLLFPEAFSVLVLSKAYSVAKSALVPGVVHAEGELVRANSRLSLLSGIMAFVAAVPGGIAVAIAGGQGALVLAVAAFAGAGVLGVAIPATRVASSGESTLERDELHGAGILLAASAMGLLRGIVGFLTFLLAFELRTGGAPPWQFGLVLAASAVGSLAGAVIAPALREGNLLEERIIQLLLGLTAAGGLAAAYMGELVGGVLLAAAVAVAASASKLAFDAIVQRDAPDANRGRSFARFETRFQLIWVIGGFTPVLLPIPARLGFLMVAGAAVFAMVSYLIGARAVAQGQVPRRRRVDLRVVLRSLRHLPRPASLRRSRHRADPAASTLMQSPSGAPTPVEDHRPPPPARPPPPPPPPPPPAPTERQGGTVVDPTRLQ